MTTKAKRKTAPKAKGDNVVALRALCEQLKIDAYTARVKLRSAVEKGEIKHDRGTSWEWPKGAAALSDVRKILGE